MDEQVTVAMANTHSCAKLRPTWADFKAFGLWCHPVIFLVGKIILLVTLHNKVSLVTLVNYTS